MMVAGLVLLLGVLVGAHGAGLVVTWLTRRRHARVSDTMPGLSVREQGDGRPAARFDRSVARVEGGVLKAALAAPTGLEATALATRLGAPREAVAAVLESIGARVPHKLRVTRSGRLLWDFDPAGLRRLRGLGGTGLLRRLGTFALAALANIGATWPLFATLVVAGATLASLEFGAGVETEVLVLQLALGLLLIGLVLGVSVGLGWLLGLVTGPLVSGPDPAAPLSADAPHEKDAGPGWTPPKWLKDLGDLAGGVLGDVRDIRAVLVLVVVALFAAAVLGAFAGLVAWVAGLWRAARERRDLFDQIAPGRWVREGRQPGAFASLLPTSDVAMRLLGAVGHAVAARRPVDGQLRERVLARAMRQGGRIAALQIALQEGFDLEEAVAVGARICADAEGEIVVSEAGDLAFLLPRTSLPQAALALASAPMEALIRGPDGAWTSATGAGVPVNVPGLTRGHLLASRRLAAGTLLLGGGALFTFLAMAGELGVPGWVTPLAIALVGALVWSVAALMGAGRYAARLYGRLGLLRDVRRATCAALVLALKRKQPWLDSEALAASLTTAARSAWPQIAAADVGAEVDRTLSGLGVELSLEASADEAGRPMWSVSELARRLASCQQAQPETALGGAGDDDEVVYQVDSEEAAG